MTTAISEDAWALHTHGAVSPIDVDYARTRITSVLHYARDPVLFLRVKLTRLADPALERPALAQVNLDLDGRLIRAQVARPTMREAIDEAHDRLRDRVQRATVDWEAIRGGRPSDDLHEWRRMSVPAERPGYFPRPVEEREIIRHKAFGLARMTIDEAAFDMEMLDYSFHLFIEHGSGIDSVLYRTDGSAGYRLAQVDLGAQKVIVGATSVTISPLPALRLTADEAVHRLDATDFPFVFFRDTTTNRGCVLYHRYDGHYGLITPAG